MRNGKIVTIDGGSAQYWRDRHEGFRLIREAEEAASWVSSLQWQASISHLDPDDRVIDDSSAIEALADAFEALESNETAVSILVAQRRTVIGNYIVSAVVRALEQP